MGQSTNKKEKKKHECNFVDPLASADLSVCVSFLSHMYVLFRCMGHSTCINKKPTKS